MTPMFHARRLAAALALSRVDEFGTYHSPNICFATESPLIHDGAQTTAAVDLSATGAGLTGNNSTGQFLAVKITGARQINLANAGGEAIYGILQNQPQAGQAADVGILGVSMGVAGAAFAAGAYLMTDTSGRLITATGVNHRVAQAIEAAGALGDIVAVVVLPVGNTVA